MLSLEKIKQSLHNPDMSDEETLKIRDDLHQLAEIIFEKWQKDRKKAKEKTLKRDI